MNGLEPGQEEAATAKGSRVERVRQMVDDAYAEGSSDEVYGPGQDLPSTTRTALTKEGEPVDEDRRQRIKEAEAAVEAAIETMPKPEPSQLEDLLLG